MFVLFPGRSSFLRCPFPPPPLRTRADRLAPLGPSPVRPRHFLLPTRFPVLLCALLRFPRSSFVKFKMVHNFWHWLVWVFFCFFFFLVGCVFFFCVFFFFFFVVFFFFFFRVCFFPSTAGPMSPLFFEVVKRGLRCRVHSMPFSFLMPVFLWPPRTFHKECFSPP